MNSKEYQIITWEEWIVACKKLSTQLPKKSSICFIPRGGLFVAGTLLYINPLLRLWVNNPLLAPSPAVIVDDVCCSGKTAQNIRTFCKAGKDLFFGAVFYRKSSIEIPDYFGEEIDHEKYLLFPWESGWRN